ncbi:hypothetical protein N7448_006084 [Penicillium atrosanguineum]|uniref:Beta-glucuronidase C-terminal domain-containing protein n=1 Tax=Penicillium atrosanguineum TaxID=1132637 RepID=A0A9W9PQY9_9EURO|nr:hypothetical protein N7448_006084 [Penicillium atrosanguineum]KAJ5307411.1 hypothetical protein N7476_008067 [Penicillium atrosanguineum]
MRSFSLAGFALLLDQVHCHINSLAVPKPLENSSPVSRDFQSFSIEFAFFPDYAGNQSHPNKFSKNLLGNFKSITGVLPKVRVGGTTQDKANYFPDQEEGIKLIFEKPTDDQPDQINYGPAFFESYHTLGNIHFFHGLNMNQNSSMAQLTEAAVVACQSIGPQLELYELGNEWNYASENYRSGNYSELDYVQEWNRKTSLVQAAVQKACPGLIPGFMAPSFILMDETDSSGWTAEELYKLGYDPKFLTRELSFHNYMGANAPSNPPAALQLQETLMNHTNIVSNLAAQIERSHNLAYLGHPYTLGELNSMANQGINGVTDVFGDALWLVDFSLWAVAHNFERLHFHQGLNYRYASWQPIVSEGELPATRPPYYGQIMVASAIGHAENAHIVNIPLSEDAEAAYAVYNGEKLSKLVAVNMRAHNATTTGSRPSREYKFKVAGDCHAKVERLIAPGCDSLEGVTFGGVSYDYSLLGGMPVVIDKREETLSAKSGVLSVDVPDSSAVLVSFF